MPTKIGKILIRSVQVLFWFLMLWAGIASITAYPLYLIFGDSPTLVRSLLAVSFLATCYSCWALHRYVNAEDYEAREYKREQKQMQRDAAERERSKLYRFMVNGGAFAILLALLLLWALFSQLI